MHEVKMPKEGMQRLGEVGMLRWIYLLLPHRGRPFPNQFFKLVRDNPGSLRSSVLLLCYSSTLRVGIPVTQVENINAVRTGSGKTKPWYSTVRCKVGNYSNG